RPAGTGPMTLAVQWSGRGFGPAGRPAAAARGADTNMATIRASCPDCGDVELTIADVTVRVCADDDRGAYVFTCPSCRMAVHKDAEPRIVDLLVSSGVRAVHWR